MFLMYTDESGDTGLLKSPTRYYILTGLIVHELRWKSCLDQLIEFRRKMNNTFKLKLRDEIHSTELINHPGKLSHISKGDRLTILRMYARELATMTDISIINVVIDKQGKSADYDCFTKAWQALIQRFENTMSYGNFPGPKNPEERGMIFPDRTDDKKLVQLLRKMRHFNPVPNQPIHGSGYRDLQIKLIIEDPTFKDSATSYFTQSCDVMAYLLKQLLQPNKYMQKKGADRYFKILNPILCRVASNSDPDGIVRL